MSRRLIGGLAACALITGAGAVSSFGAANTAVVSPILERFLAARESATIPYRALRHVEAQCEHFASNAWMDVWTEVDAAGAMQYSIAGEGGSNYIRSKIFRGVLDAERRAVNSGVASQSEITLDNYAFDAAAAGAEEGLTSLAIKPKRKDVLLVDGLIFLTPADAALVRLQGRLSKNPSFWVRRVEIIRHYKRVGGMSMPVALESAANLLVAGRSTFKMTYDYESVNGKRVGTPQPRLVASAQP